MDSQLSATSGRRTKTKEGTDEPQKSNKNSPNMSILFKVFVFILPCLSNSDLSLEYPISILLDLSVSFVMIRPWNSFCFGSNATDKMLLHEMYIEQKKFSIFIDIGNFVFI